MAALIGLGTIMTALTLVWIISVKRSTVPLLYARNVRQS
jgi:hypothetical protein